MLASQRVVAAADNAMARVSCVPSCSGRGQMHRHATPVRVAPSSGASSARTASYRGSCSSCRAASASPSLLSLASSSWEAGSSQERLQAQQQLLERSLNPVPLPPLPLADPATSVLVQAEVLASLEAAAANGEGVWGFFSGGAMNAMRDPREPICIEMIDGHHVFLAPSLFKVSPATFALARVSIAAGMAGATHRPVAAAAASMQSASWVQGAQ